VHQSPSAHAWFLCALDSAIGPVHDVVIVGERDDEDTRAMITGLREHYLPSVMIVYRQPSDDDSLLASLAPFTRNLNTIGGKATAYICTGHTCSLPITEPHQMLELLSRVIPDK
jgi:uncharacterized protein YyaL (SSP411 family)